MLLDNLPKQQQQQHRMAKIKRKSLAIAASSISEEPQFLKPNPPPISAVSKIQMVAGLKTPSGNLENQEPMDVDLDIVPPQIEDEDEGGTRIGDIYIPPPIQPYCSSESKGPRLIITKIENENFKSYAGKVILGPFHHCFTAIIGPNGSGKSNVIDSMLFVFGYRANKIRCKKVSTLLHNSARFPNSQMCSVGIHLKEIIDKGNNVCEDIPNSEIIISRTAFRDNSSYYMINGRRCQFKDVAKLLKQHGVDLDHNRFLILQGEVESIAMMKSKAVNDNECGMLEYLEDIIGTVRYKEPLMKLNALVDKLNEELNERLNRCKLAEREMKDLEKPFNEAIEFLKLENSLTRTKNLKLQKYMHEHRKKLAEYTNQREEVNNQLKEHDEEYDKLKQERTEKENAIRKEIEKFEEMCKEKEDMEQKLKEALKNFTETQATMAALNKKRKQNKTQLQTLEEKLIQLQKLPEKNEKEIKECENKLEKLNKQKTDLEDELQKNYTVLEDQTRPLIEKRDNFQTELVDLKKNVDVANGELCLAESELKLLRQDEITESRKYETLRSSFEEMRNEMEEKISQISEYKKNIPELQTEIQGKINQLRENKDEENHLRNTLFTIKAEITDKMSNLQAAKTNNKVLDSLMNQKLEGKIPGILGRLGDLGAISATYDVAISTACGRLDNIVVDSVNTAQACIEHLKRYDIGRASFIALEKIQHLKRHYEQKIQTPENVPRLFDLVKVEDERVLPAFYFALGDTLVAKDIEQATRIAYGPKRYRVVDLEGSVIEIFGTMSGGGKNKIRGKMGQKVATKTKDSRQSLVSQKNIEELQRKAEEIQFRINYLQEQQGLLERDIESLKNSIRQKESEIKKMQITTSSFQQQLPRLREQLEMQKERTEKTKTDEKQVKKLENEIEEKRKVYEKSDAAAKKITDKIDKINKEIADLHGDKVKSVQAKITNVTKQIKALNTNINKLKVDIKTSERNYNKTENEIIELRKEIENAESSIKELCVDRARYDTEGSELTKRIDEAKEMIETANQDSSQIKKEILIIQKKEETGKHKRLEIEQSLQAIDKKISDVKAQIPHCERELKPLKLHEIPLEENPEEPLKTYTEEELETQKLQDIQYQYSVQEEKLNAKKPNLSTIEEYLNKRDVYLGRVKVLEDITSTRNNMRKVCDDVRKRRFTEFMQGFHIIGRKVKEMYRMITQGGDAELELVDSMDPFTEGVSFSVRPPKKSWKNISNLSGGEKTLSSLALVFALHYYKPSPLYFLDEIDAALDFKNISIVAHYIKERTKNAQFIIISLRSNMFELSDYIVGIYKVCDCTNTITIRNEVPDFTRNENLTNNNDDNQMLIDPPEEDSSKMHDSPLQEGNISMVQNSRSIQEAQLQDSEEINLSASLVSPRAFVQDEEPQN